MDGHREAIRQPIELANIEDKRYDPGAIAFFGFVRPIVDGPSVRDDSAKNVANCRRSVTNIKCTNEEVMGMSESIDDGLVGFQEPVGTERNRSTEAALCIDVGVGACCARRA